MIFPRLLDAGSYFPGLWDLRRDERARRHWRRVFSLQMEEMARRVEERRGKAAEQAAAAARCELEALLDAEEGDDRAPGHVHHWTLLRERALDACGVPDPYRELKDEETRAALALLPAVLARSRAAQALPARLRRAAALVFAGNRFDLGSPAAAAARRDGEAGFAELARAAEGSPWLRDGSGGLAAWLQGGRARRALVLADNAGPDFVCGLLPLALLLVELGLCVDLAANEGPALNDVTAAEAEAALARAAALDAPLEGALAEGRLRVLSTGTRAPGIDLRSVSPALARAGAEADLLVLEGQGRGAETNWRARFDLPVVRLLTLKDPLVAEALGGRVWDAVCDWRPAGVPPPGERSAGARAVTSPSSP